MGDGEPRKKNRGALIGCGVVIGIVIVILAVVLSQPRGNSSSSASKTGSAGASSSGSSSSFVGTGDLGVIRASSGGSIPAGVTKADFDRMTQLAVAKDEVGFRKMVMDGRVLLLPAGTKVRAIGVHITYYEVRVLDGTYQGDSAFVASDFVTK